MLPLTSICSCYCCCSANPLTFRYLEAGLLSGADAAALRHSINVACKQLGSNGAVPALKLCEAFGIPDHLLAAPIAFNWRAMGESLYN